MILSQKALAAAAHERAADVARSLAGHPSDTAALVVVRTIDVRSFVEGASAFAWGLEPQARAEWYASFTRTVFLAGDCTRLLARHRPRHVSPDGAIGWFGPAPQREHTALRRLLRAFEGPAPASRLSLGGSVRLPGDGRGHARRRRLLVDVGHASVQELLIHLHHTLSEAVIRGVVRPGDAIELRGVDAIERWTGAWDYARVHTDREHEGRLRMYTLLGPAGVGGAGARDG